MVDESRPHGTVGVRYNDLIDAIAKALETASNPVNISDHDPWMHRLATRLADIDIRMNKIEDWAKRLDPTYGKLIIADLTREDDA
jgi:hypothetical protein